MRKRAVVIAVVVLAAAVTAYLFRDRLRVFPGVLPLPASAPAPAAPAAPVAAVPAPVPAPAAEQKIEKEAKTFVKTLSQSQPEPVSVEKADHFMHPDQSLSLITKEDIQQTTPEKLLKEPGITPDTPITVVKRVEQIEPKTPEKLIAESGGDLDKPVKVLEGGEVKEKTVRQVVEEHRAHPEKPIKVVKSVDYYEKTTPRKLEQDKSLKKDTPIRVITKPYSMPSETVGELMSGKEDVTPDSIFYVRTVRPSDSQGIWGIIRDGLMENFGRGMAIRRGKTVDTYKVDIPRFADEKLADESSSFLGKLIFDKTRKTYVYNYQHGHMGRDPDLIYPGQEIVIVTFQPQELIDIYKHFVGERG